MLTREKLNDTDWVVIRDTPHHVIIAMSSTGGSPLDELLEHSAGMKGIVDAMNSTHPLVREIAVGVNIMQAQKSVQDWYRSLDAIDRSSVTLQDKAIDSMKSALDVLRAHGGPEDLLHYSDFVRSLAMRVARAAREGDVLGAGGELVSPSERRFLDRLEALAK
jgi:hypothetical protein